MKWRPVIVIIATYHRRQKSMGDHHSRGVCRSRYPCDAWALRQFAIIAVSCNYIFYYWLNDIDGHGLDEMFLSTV